MDIRAHALFSSQSSCVSVAWLLRSTNMAACLLTNFLTFFCDLLVFLRFKNL